MTIYAHIGKFYGLDIEEFDESSGIRDASLALRIEVDWNAAENGEEIEDIISAVAEDPKAKDVKALVIGAWEEPFDTTAQPLIDFLVKKNDVFKSLEALFVAEMTSEENEISWIQQGDYSGLWTAYPNLKHLQIRGAEGLELGDVSHNTLETLIVESGGLPSSVVEAIGNSSLPSLKHLEVWFGDENYGWDGDISTITPLLDAQKFPSLKYLGLMNSEIQDEIATAVVESEILKQMEHLNLSKGVMSDVGGNALLENAEKLSHLLSLNLAHHYMSDEVSAKLKMVCKSVDVSEKREVDEYDGEEYRYVEVAE